MKCKFSIVTVCYNSEKTIENTIISVLKQRYSNLEYIIVDGCSNDATINLINKYRERLNNLISEKDSGIYDAMNKGINVASGDYIIFMNAGDMFFNDNVLSEIAKTVNNNSCDVIYGNVVNEFRGKKHVVKAKDLTRIKYDMVFSHQSVFVKTELAKRLKFDTNYKYAADYGMLLKLFNRGATFRYVEIPISIVDVGSGATYDHFYSSRKEVFEIQKSEGLADLKHRVYFVWTIFRLYAIKYIKLFVTI